LALKAWRLVINVANIAMLVSTWVTESIIESKAFITVDTGGIIYAFEAIGSTWIASVVGIVEESFGTLCAIGTISACDTFSTARVAFAVCSKIESNVTDIAITAGVVTVHTVWINCAVWDNLAYTITLKCVSGDADFTSERI